MISNAKIKFIQSLHSKKKRDEEGLFIIEGEKVVVELLESDYEVVSLFATSSWLQKSDLSKLSNGNNSAEIEAISENELERISMLSAPNSVLAVAKVPTLPLDFMELQNSFYLVLDEIKDPGNMGTIIRIADWFGIRNIICSENSVDVFNPKVVQASMGSLFRVKVNYTNLESFFSNPLRGIDNPVIGTFLNGVNIYDCHLPIKGAIIMGNESLGISEALNKFITLKVMIPKGGKSGAESLNVGVATGIVMGEIFRNSLKTKK